MAEKVIDFEQAKQRLKLEKGEKEFLSFGTISELIQNGEYEQAREEIRKKIEHVCREVFVFEDDKLCFKNPTANQLIEELPDFLSEAMMVQLNRASRAVKAPEKSAAQTNGVRAFHEMNTLTYFMEKTLTKAEVRFDKDEKAIMVEADFSDIYIPGKRKIQANKGFLLIRSSAKGEQQIKWNLWFGGEETSLRAEFHPERDAGLQVDVQSYAMDMLGDHHVGTYSHFCAHPIVFEAIALNCASRVALNLAKNNPGKKEEFLSKANEYATPAALSAKAVNILLSKKEPDPDLLERLTKDAKEKGASLQYVLPKAA